MQRLVAWAMLMACGCGGGAATGNGPTTATDESASSARDEARPTADDEDTPEVGDEAEIESATSTLEGEELASVLQSVLSDPELIDNLHLKKPGRSPLKVAGPDLPPKLGVVVGAHEVKVVDEPTSGKAAVLIFNKIERTGDQVRVHYRFDVEGLQGRASLNLKGGRWELASNRVVTK
jgi:hypothetical protein